MSNIEIQLKPVDAVAAGTIAWGASDELADLKGKASGMLLKEMDKVGGRAGAFLVETGEEVRKTAVEAHKQMSDSLDYAKLQAKVLLKDEKVLQTLDFEEVTYVDTDGVVHDFAPKQATGKIAVTNKRLIFLSCSPTSKGMAYPSDQKLTAEEKKAHAVIKVETAYLLGDVNWYSAFPLSVIKLVEAKMELGTTGWGFALAKLICCCCGCPNACCTDCCIDDTCSGPNGCCSTCCGGACTPWSKEWLSPVLGPTGKPEFDTDGNKTQVTRQPKNIVTLRVVDNWDEKKKTLKITVKEPSSWDGVVAWIQNLQAMAPGLNPAAMSGAPSDAKISEEISFTPRASAGAL